MITDNRVPERYFYKHIKIFNEVEFSKVNWMIEK